MAHLLRGDKLIGIARMISRAQHAVCDAPHAAAGFRMQRTPRSLLPKLRADDPACLRIDADLRNIPERIQRQLERNLDQAAIDRSDRPAIYSEINRPARLSVVLGDLDKIAVRLSHGLTC